MNTYLIEMLSCSRNLVNLFWENKSKIVGPGENKSTEKVSKNIVDVWMDKPSVRPCPNTKRNGSFISLCHS